MIEPLGCFERFAHRLRFLPVWFGFRLIWLAALTGDRDAEDVYVAIWLAGLDLPPIAQLVRRADDAIEAMTLPELRQPLKEQPQ